MPLIAQRLNRISPSQTIAISQLARHLAASGKEIISLSAGEPDFETPENIKKAACAAIGEGLTRYTDVAGTFPLREAAAQRLNEDFSLDYKAQEIMISTGGKQALFNVFLATVEAGDEVIIPAPAWVSYPDIVSLAEGTPVIVQTTPEEGFRLTAQALRDAITPKTKWLILNSPNNPTGVVYHESDLRALADVLLEFPNVWVLTDDIYTKLVFDGQVAKTLLQIEPKLRDRMVIVNGVSKAYAMTGWRIGFAAAPVALIQALTKLQSQSTSNACSIAQAAALEALTGPQHFIKEMCAVYQRRRDLVLSMLAETRGIECSRPEGAFYVFPSIKSFIQKKTRSGQVIENDEMFVKALLEEKGVAAVHGSAFLTPDYFRISYATDEKSLVEAGRRIQDFCRSLS